MASMGEFREYYLTNIDDKVQDFDSYEIERAQFLQEYPMERIKDLTLDEYCLGTDVSKGSLCYAIEFGKYKYTGFGIGGGSAKKYGVYFNKSEQCYKRGSEVIGNIDGLWPKFKNEMYRFLVDSGQNDAPVILEDYPLLQGMAMVLTKFLCLYYPKKYITIGSIYVLRLLFEKCGYNYDDNMRCNQLNYIFNENIRRDIPETANYSDASIGHLAWEYLSLEDAKRTSKEPGLGDADVQEKGYWVYSPGRNASKWEMFSSEGIMGIGWEELGDLTSYDTRNDMKDMMQELYDPDKTYTMDSLATWEFVNSIQIGDVVYAKRGMHKLVGRGIVTSKYYFDEEVDDSYKHLRNVEWTDIGEWDFPGQAPMKTLTEFTPYTDMVEKLESLFADPEGDDSEDKAPTWPSYNREIFLNEVYMDESSYNTLVGLIRNKKNVILQGAPGVGKTYAANRLAYSIMGEKNKDRVMMVQFHQSYSYEDFIEGFRPASDNNGFEIKKGSFYNFCKKAAEDIDNEYFFIIDEINRGNLSKIFGELFMLIEKDKRGNSLQLLYSDEKFYVPRNVYIIGMMNTADRSLALLDYALRRRFAFYDMKPAFDQKKFVEYRMGLDNTKFNNLIECVKKLNEKIKDDASLGEGFCIGHSYFCDLKEVTDVALNSIVEYELIPLLKEYWFDDQATVRDWTEKLRSSIK